MINKFKLDDIKNVSAKEMVSRTLEIANHYAGELSIEVLPLNQLELDPDNHRELSLTLQDAMQGIEETDPAYEKKKKDWRSLESLAKTIKDGQLINPIYVYRFGNKCRLIAGERRTLASAIAGKKEIIARIADQRPLGVKLKVLQWIENNERSDLSLSERVASIEAIVCEYKKEHTQGQGRVTAKLLGQLTGMSITQARRYILILHSRPEMKRAIQAGQVENIKLVELICSTNGVEHQSELLQAAIAGASFEKISKLKKVLDTSIKKKTASKGKKKGHVRLGSARTHVVELLVNALLTSDALEAHVIQRIREVCNTLKWSDVESTEEGFKKIMIFLEQDTAQA